MGSQVKWGIEEGGVSVVERHLFGLLCFPDSLTFAGPLPRCFCLGLFLASSWDEGLNVWTRAVWINWLVCVTDPVSEALYHSRALRSMTPKTHYISLQFYHESARRPSSSISPSFITNVFTANQCNGLDCEHLNVCLTYISCGPREMTGPLQGWW